jgi:hypothetical protein
VSSAKHGRLCPIYLGCAISKVAPEGLGGVEIILLCESEINQHGDIFIREKNVRRPGEGFSATRTSYTPQYSLDVIVYDSMDVKEPNAA